MPTNYPESHVDLFMVRQGLSQGNISEAYQALEAIERGAPIVCSQESIGYEEMRTKSGTMRLEGTANMKWYFNGGETSLPVLCLQFPQYRDYLVSRTETVVDYWQPGKAEFDSHSSDGQRFLTEQIQRLQEELLQVQRLPA